MTREEAIQEVKKAFEPAFANYIITALTEGATVSDKEEGLEELLESLQKANKTNETLIKLLENKKDSCKELFDDWHEAPSYAMTLEQAREAVHELRKENVKLRREASEWQQDHAILKAHSDGANEVIDRVKQAREEIADRIDNYPDRNISEYEDCLAILDKLIAEVEGTNEAN